MWIPWVQEKQQNQLLKPTSLRFSGVNLLADERLGTWLVGRRIVELFEVTFPNLATGVGRIRYVGLTASGHERPIVADIDAGGVFESLDALTERLDAFRRGELFTRQP